MNLAIFLLVILNFLYIGLLPVVFFKRDGRLNALWWLTAAPFVLCISFITMSFIGCLSLFFGSHSFWNRVIALFAIPINVGSIALISFTLGCHRIPIALWHQTNDAPQQIVTWGAYKYVRHPFYTAFLLAFLGAFLYCPQVGTLFTLVYGCFILNTTADKEEKRLLSSDLGSDYTNYMAITGRFIPIWGRKAK